MLTRDLIMKKAERGNITRNDFVDIGYDPSTVQKHLQSLVAEGQLHAYKVGGVKTYSTKPRELKDPSRSRKTTTKLPDLPPIMLEWLGYTDKVPDPMYAVFVHGGQW